MAPPNTDEKLQNTPPFRCNPDGIARVWAYIGTDDPTRGASHGAVALADLVAQKLGVKMLYVDQFMLEKSFPKTHSIAAQLPLLLAREGLPDILIGQYSTQITDVTGATPTFLIDTIMTTMATNLFQGGKMAEIVPHHVTPGVLHQAGQKFLARHPALKHPLTAIFVNTTAPTEESIQMLADACRATEGTFYFCPSPRRTDPYYYEMLTDGFAAACKGQNKEIVAADMRDVQLFYNPYLGLLDQADHVIVLGESRSVVSEALVDGRPVHVDWKPGTAEYFEERHYAALENDGYVKCIYGQEAGKPLDSAKLPPLNSTEAIADHIVREFDQAARMRTLRPDIMCMQNPCSPPITPAKGPV